MVAVDILNIKYIIGIINLDNVISLQNYTYTLHGLILTLIHCDNYIPSKNVFIYVSLMFPRTSNRASSPHKNNIKFRLVNFIPVSVVFIF